MSNVPSLWYHYSLFSFAHNFSSQAFSDNPIWLIERKGKRMIYWVVPFLMVGGRWKSAIDGGAWARSRTEMLILPKASMQCWFITIGQESVPEKRQKVNLASLYFYFLVSVGITHWVINNQTKLGPSFASPVSDIKYRNVLWKSNTSPCRHAWLHNHDHHHHFHQSAWNGLVPKVLAK